VQTHSYFIRLLANSIALSFLVPEVAGAQAQGMFVSATYSDSESSNAYAYSIASQNAIASITSQCRNEGLGLADYAVGNERDSRTGDTVTVTVTATGHCTTQ
jgi:hypothetical protein